LEGCGWRTPESHRGRYWRRPSLKAIAEIKRVPPTPFHGYYYPILTLQGKQADGGAKNYIVGGKMTEGFAFVAYPADYRSSGVMDICC